TQPRSRTRPTHLPGGSTMLRFNLFFTFALLCESPDVDALIERLGDDRFTVRVTAQRDLERQLASPNGHHYRLAVEAGCRHEAPEIAKRAAAALDAFYDVRPSGYPMLPWIDMLPPQFAERQMLIDRHLACVRPPGSGWSGPDW